MSKKKHSMCTYTIPIKLQYILFLHRAAGGCFNNVVKTTVLLNNISDYGVMNEVYKEFFTMNEPARSAYQVAALPLGALIEIEAIAAIGNIQDQ